MYICLKLRIYSAVYELTMVVYVDAPDIHGTTKFRATGRIYMGSLSTNRNSICESFKMSDSLTSISTLSDKKVLYAWQADELYVTRHLYFILLLTLYLTFTVLPYLLVGTDMCDPGEGDVFSKCCSWLFSGELS